jgi:hypothetical protein
VEGEGPHGQQTGGRRTWVPHLTRAGTWFVGTVVAAIIGVVVPGLIGGWLPGMTGDDDDGETETGTARRPPPVRPSRLVFALRVSFLAGGD